MMKQTLLTIALLGMGIGLWGQERYADEIFSGVTVTEDVVFSSNFGAADLAIDGNIFGANPWSGANLQHTQTESQPWWMLDLGGQAELQDVKLYNRSNCCQNRMSNFYVFVSETPLNPNESIEELKTAATAYEYVAGKMGSMGSYSFAGNTARYVLVKLTERNPLHMAEVEVYGCLSGARPPARFSNVNTNVEELPRIAL